MARVGFMIDTLAPGAGTENQLILLLSRLEAHGHACHLAFLETHPRFPEAGVTVPVYEAGVGKLASFRGAAGMVGTARWMRRSRLDVLVTFFRDAGLFGTVAARLAGLPVVAARRNLGYWQSPREIRLLRTLRPWIHAYVANSEAARDHTAEIEGVDPVRIAVIPNAVDGSRFHPATAAERRALRNAYGFPLEAPLVLCVANLRPVKGHDTLLRAFTRVPKDAHLLLAGDGPEEGALRADCAKLGLDGRVHFLGRVPDPAPFMRLADMGVLASRSESLPNALVEMASVGLPLVATRAGGNEEVLAGGQAGVLVEVDDAVLLGDRIAAFLANETERRDLADKARRHAASVYDQDRVVRMWAEALTVWSRRGVPDAGAGIRSEV